MAAIALPERLTDLDVDSPPEDRKPLIWDEASGRWVQQSFNPGIVVIGDDTTGGLANSGLEFNNVATTDQLNTVDVNLQNQIDGIDDTLAGLGTAAVEDVGNGAGNVPQLDGNGKLLTSILPAIAITDTFVVASQAAMLALAAETGDVAVRTDLNKSFILKVNNPAVLANWQELLTPTDTVLSVNGQTGVVVLTTTNVVEGTNLYYTNARVQAFLNAGVTITGGNLSLVGGTLNVNGFIVDGDGLVGGTGGSFSGELIVTTLTVGAGAFGTITASNGGDAETIKVNDGGFTATGGAGQRCFGVHDLENADRLSFYVLNDGAVGVTTLSFYDTANETYSGNVVFSDNELSFAGTISQVSVAYIQSDDGVAVVAGPIQTATGWLAAYFPGSGAIAVDGLILENPTAASGTTTSQWAPVFRSRARAWKTNATAASHTSDWRWVNAPTSGAAAITGVYKLQHSNNGAAYADSFIFNEAGDLTILRDFSCRDSTPRNVVASRRVIAGTVTLTDGATVNIDASLGNSFELTAAGNRTIAAPTNATNNHVITIVHLASGGARTPTFDTGAGGFAFTDSVSAAIATASGKITVYTCRYTTLGGLNKWLILGAATQS